MFNIVRKSRNEKPNLNYKQRIKLLKNINTHKYPIKVGEFSSLRNNNKNDINSSEKKEEIKINYIVEDTRSFDGLLISLTSIGNIFIYDIYSKKLKKITCFGKSELRAKGIHINSLRNSLIVTSFSHLNGINNIHCFEIFLDVLKKREKFNINNFIQILRAEEFLDSECFVQFDEYNKVILSRNILRTNKIWNFANYEKNFEFTYSTMNEIRMTGGVLLLCEKSGENIRQYNINIFDIKKGKKIFQTEIAFKPNKKIIFFEFIKNYLFTKQVDNYPLYINLITNEIKIIKEEIDSEALFIYTGNTNKFILISLDRYLIFNIEGILLKKIVNNNLSIEIKQNDICSPITNNKNIPFIICWHLANVSFSESNTISLRKSNSFKSINSSQIFSQENSQKISPIINRDNSINNNNNYVDNNFVLYSPLSDDNPNNLGFLENDLKFGDKYSIEGLYGEHQLDIIYMDDINFIRKINFKINFNQNIMSINYIQESNSVFIISCFGDIYEILL